MHGTISEKVPTGTLSAAGSCNHRHDLAEPLWFAVMCRALWGGNACKELQFILAHSHRPSLGRSDRTSRAWATGESEPPASVMVALIFSDHGWRVLEYLFQDSVVAWWGKIVRALKVTDQVDKLDLD